MILSPSPASLPSYVSWGEGFPKPSPTPRHHKSTPGHPQPWQHLLTLVAVPSPCRGISFVRGHYGCHQLPCAIVPLTAIMPADRGGLSLSLRPVTPTHTPLLLGSRLGVDRVMMTAQASSRTDRHEVLQDLGCHLGHPIPKELSLPTIQPIRQHLRWSPGDVRRAPGNSAKCWKFVSVELSSAWCLSFLPGSLCVCMFFFSPSSRWKLEIRG